MRRRDIILLALCLSLLTLGIGCKQDKSTPDKALTGDLLHQAALLENIKVDAKEIGVIALMPGIPEKTERIVNHADGAKADGISAQGYMDAQWLEIQSLKRQSTKFDNDLKWERAQFWSHRQRVLIIWLIAFGVIGLTVYGFFVKSTGGFLPVILKGIGWLFHRGR